ncbi:hypothetical protein Lepto7376_1911 [[Leptolyngbya] sp. PCC 7376]|uniref:hypothetical protein n=1 Tax=[Leptolyngbya] sp. PCC 7376 TaxID=111781 RepID=UPI00029EEAEC|nr:hypothetical protein [[Leptolyngbya] sp. PCC 7376]AFY38228.1 hypothetical protein Lepto7376_1911 [[Leptolyngbya] sp. PCC 7376]
MTNNTTTDLNKLSFQEAIAFTGNWLDQVMTSSLSDAEILSNLIELLSHRNGVRGFFVAYLTGSCPLADHPPAIFIEAFQAVASEIKEILVKNVAMSTAMAIAHSRNQDKEQQAGSEQVKRRSQNLLQTLEATPYGQTFQQERQALLDALQTQTGDYETFLQRWQYDEEQRRAIKNSLVAIAN